MISFLAVAGIFGVSSAVINKQVEDNQTIEMVKADSMGDFQYPLIIGDNNSGQNFVKDCSIAVHCWGSGWSYTMAATVIGNTLRSVCLPSNTTGFKVLRMNSSSGGFTYLPYAGYPSEGVYNALADTSFDSSKNMYQVLNESFSSTSYTVCARSVLNKGAEVRFCANKFGDWTTDNAVPYVYTYADNYYGTHAQWHQMTRIGGTQYFTYTSDAVYVLDGFIFTRNDPSGSASWGSVWTQTANVYVCRSGGLVILDGSTGGSSCSEGDDDDYAEMWGDIFLDCITCDGSGTTTGGSSWSTPQSEYNALNNDRQYIIFTAEGDIAGSTCLSRAIYRYDYILHKYGKSKYNDYVNRIDGKGSGSKYPYNAIQSFSPFSLLGDDENNLSTIIIIVSSSVALLSITALSILVIKKRKNKEE